MDNVADKKSHYASTLKTLLFFWLIFATISSWSGAIHAQATPIQAMAQCQDYLAHALPPDGTIIEACTPYQPNDDSLGAYRLYQQPAFVGSTPFDSVFRYGRKPRTPCVTSATSTCATAPRQPDKSRNPGCSQCRPSASDPIDIADGYMWRTDSDVTSKAGPSLSRNYNSQAIPLGNKFRYPAGMFGTGWRNNYSLHVYYSSIDSTTTATAARANGQTLYFTKTAQGWTPDPDIYSRLIEVDNAGALTGWQYFDADSGDIETYDLSGFLTNVTHRDGRSLALSYDINYQLMSVTDDYGRQIRFTYLAINGAPTGQVQTITDSAGNVWTYTYDAQGKTLLTVINPDGSSVIYHHESNVDSSLLTGVGYTASGGIESRYSWFSYDDQYRAISAYEAGNVNATTLTYNADLTVTVTDQLSSAGSRSRVFTFAVPQGVAKLSSISGGCSSGCGVQAASYDDIGNAISTTDFNGVVTNRAFSDDGQGLETQRVEAAGQPEQRTIQTDWNEILRLPIERRTLNATGTITAKSDWIYNTTGQVTNRCEADPLVSGAITYTCGSSPNAPTGVRQWRYTYCTAIDATQCPLVGLLLSVDGPRTDVSDITAYGYYLSTDESGCGTTGGACHRAGDLYQMTNALGQITTNVAYDKNGRVTRITDANGINTDLTYTPRGWLATRTVGGATTTITYTPYGAVASITDADNVVVNYTYDAAHRLTRITDALGNYVQYTLDAAGNKTAEQTYDSSGTLRRSLSRTYNTLGQLTQVTDGLSHAVFNAGYSDSYDANGNRVHTADALGVQRKQGYDGLNRLVSTIDNYNGTDTATQNTQSVFAYDANDRLEGVSDPDGLSTTYSYDGLGNATGVLSPDTGSTAYVYDAAGNVTQRTDAKGVVSTSTYDALNRRTATTYADGTLNVAYSYDEPNSVTGCPASSPVGRLTRLIETAVTTVYCYDAHGNVTRKSQTQGTVTDTTSYGYTLADRLASTLTPAGTSIQYSRDAAGRISGVTALPPGTSGAGAGNVVTAISYLPFGPIASYTLGNGQTVTRSYDANYAITDVVSPALNLHFARDAMGNITALGNASGANPATETYSYDPLYRLTGLYDASNNPEETYSYSKTGDRLSKTGNGLATGAYTYQTGTHHLTAIGNAARTYDANGNTTGSVIGGDTFGYGYNGRNRMTVVQRDGSTVGTYTYNALGQRTAKVVTFPAASSARFSYDEASQLLGEYGNSSRDYIWLGDLPVATIDTTSGVSTVSYVHADGLNTARAVTSSNGNTLWQLGYQANPFSEQQPTSASGFAYNPRFPGQYYDAESGLSYNVNRDYEAATGRYVQSDPIGLEGGPSTYAYANQSPLHFDDTDGTQAYAEGPLNKGASTIYCDGIGTIAIWLFEQNPCWDDCVKEHEGVHRADALRSNPTVCSNQPAGTQVYLGSTADTYKSEVRAHSKELDCLRKKLAALKSCDQCRKAIEDRIAREEDMKGRYENWLRKNFYE